MTDRHQGRGRADPAPGGADLRAVFLDRDDTLLVDEGYMSDPARVRLVEGVPEALSRLQRAGLALVLISNQSGVARGLITAAQVQAIEARLRALLPGVTFAGAEYCFHHPDEGCACRKPAPLMLRQAARRLGIDLARSVMVGDRTSDVGAGAAAGCWTVLIGEQAEEGPQPDHRAQTLLEAVDWIVTPRGPRA